VPRISHAALIVLAAALAGCSGCDERASAAPASPADGPDGGAPQPSAAPSARPVPSASAAPDRGDFRVLKLVFTSDVKDREPVDDLKLAKAGQRVWAHVVLRNRGASPRTITLVFSVNGKERSRVDLTIQSSWSFRTYAYNTLRKTDTGELKVEVLDDAGALMTSKAIPIVKDDRPDVPGKPEPLDPSQGARAPAGRAPGRPGDPFND
jgi:hypothetical protein